MEVIKLISSIALVVVTVALIEATKHICKKALCYPEDSTS